MPDDDRKCPFCGVDIKGRTDKIFCSTPCRNAWHNMERAKRERHIREINRILKNNWRILTKLNKNGKTKVSRYKLEGMGFDRRYYTSTYRSAKGNLFLLCYDQGFLELNKDEFFLVKWKSA